MGSKAAAVNSLAVSLIIYTIRHTKINFQVFSVQLSTRRELFI